MLIKLFLIFGFSLIVALSGALVPGPLLTYTVIKTLETPRRGFLVGFWVILGHAIIEIAIIIGILKGFSLVLTNQIVVRVIGTAGGVFLVYMGLDIIIKIIRKNYKTPFSSESKTVCYPDEKSFRSNSINLLATTNYGEKINKISESSSSHEFDTDSSRKESKRKTSNPISQKSITKISNPVMGGALVSMSNPYWWVWWATVGFGFMLQYDISFSNWQPLMSFYIGHEMGDLLWYAAVSTLIFLGRRKINQRFYVTLLGFCSFVIIGFGIFLALTAFIKPPPM